MIDRVSRRVGTFPVEAPAALLAAVAVGYLLVLGLPASQPQIGQATLFALAAASAAVTFVITWAGLRALEPRRAAPAGMPQFRKADLHPDAPLRRPILAGQEFGPPEPDAPEVMLAPPVPAVPLPSFLRPSGGEPLRFVDEVVRDVPDGDVAPRAPIWFRPVQVEDEAEYVDWEDALNLPAEHGPVEVEHACAAEPDAAAAAPPEDAPTNETLAQESVADLMARLEAGLARRGDGWRPPAPDDETRAALRAVADDLRAIVAAPRRSDAA